MFRRYRKVKKVAAIASAVAVLGVLQGLLITTAMRGERSDSGNRIQSSSIQ